MKAVCSVGARVSVDNWPTEDGMAGIKITGYVARIVDKPSRRKSDVRFKYFISCEDGETRSTRLTHLKWTLLPADEQPAGQKKKRPRPNAVSPTDPSVHTTLGNDPQFIDPYKFILAPMVGGSELAFRLLCRRYGATLAYTPMMSSEHFAHSSDYRAREFQTCAADTPVVAHFSANDPEVLLAAARFVEHSAFAVDINLGCPQRVAHAGHFGSFLLDEVDRPLVLAMVRRVSSALSIPVFVKIRLLETLPLTLTLCTQLHEAGASLIAIHARHRVNLVGRTGAGARDGAALLDWVRDIKAALPHVRIIANGNIITHQDALNNIAFTKADGVMSAEGLLDNPCLYSADAGDLDDARRLQLADEYLELVEAHPASMKSVIFHTRRICAAPLARFQLLEDVLRCENLTEVRKLVSQARHWIKEGGFIADPAKEKRAKDAAQRKKHEEGRRREFEKRMVRKAKREGLPEHHYLLVGAEVPAVEELARLRGMVREESFALWKERHSQHCFAFHLESGGCPRDRACTFLHADASHAESLSYG